MELDVALAVKYSTLEKESQFSQLEVIISAIDNVIRAQGAKIKKRKPRQSLIRPYKTPDEAKAVDDLPRVEDVIRQLSGGMTIVNMEGILDGK